MLATPIMWLKLLGSDAGILSDGIEGIWFLTCTWIDILAVPVLIIDNQVREIRCRRPGVVVWKTRRVITAGILSLSLAALLGTGVFHKQAQWHATRDASAKFSKILNGLQVPSETVVETALFPLSLHGPVLIAWRRLGDDNFIIYSNSQVAGYTVPSSPAEVRVLVTVIGEGRVVRIYNHGRDIQNIFRVYVWKWPEKIVVSYAVFEGTEPSDSSGSPAAFNDIYGSQPWDDVSRWLKPLLK